MVMKILITGASGFIGKSLIPRIQNNYQISLLVSDLRDHNSVRQEIEAIKPDLVLHLAARTEVEKSFYEQTVFCDINYTGTVNLIECLASVVGTPKIIFASTMEVFGWQPISDKIKCGCNIESLPVFDPDVTTPNPNAPYAVAKLACEKYLEYAHRSLDLEYVILRQTNSYGRQDNSFFVTEQIISQMLTSPASCNLGYQKPYRNFLYIDDLIDAWITVIERFDEVSNNIFTLGPDNAIQIEEYAAMISRKLDWSGEIKWGTKPVRAGEIYLLNSDYKKISDMTGWCPKISLDQGIEKTIELWQKILS